MESADLVSALVGGDFASERRPTLASPDMPPHRRIVRNRACTIGNSMP